MPVVAPSAGAAGSNTLTVKAGEYTYKLSGSPKAGWTQINFQNDGNEYHMMAVFSLKKGVTVAQIKKAAASQDQSAFDPLAGKGQVFGAPDLLSPGEKTTVITKLPAGHYGVLCFIPAPDGESHVAHGMVKTFDVSTSKSSLTPPTDGLVAVTIADDAITLPTSGMPAHGWAKVTNNAYGAAELRRSRASRGDHDLRRGRTRTSTTFFSRARLRPVTRRPRSRVARSRSARR